MKKKDKREKVELKPFQVKHHLFYPTVFSSSLKEGYVYYILSFNRKGIVQLEVNSPRFRSEEEARAHVEKLNR